VFSALSLDALSWAALQDEDLLPMGWDMVVKIIAEQASDHR